MTRQGEESQGDQPSESENVGAGPIEITTYQTPNQLMAEVEGKNQFQILIYFLHQNRYLYMKCLLYLVYLG